MAYALSYYPITNTGCNDANKLNANFAALLEAVNDLLDDKVDGSGTPTYIPYWSSASTLGDSILYYDAVNSRIGIGDTNPSEKLTVNGAIWAKDSYASIISPATDWDTDEWACIHVGHGNHTLYGFGGGGAYGSIGIVNGAKHTDSTTTWFYDGDVPCGGVDVEVGGVTLRTAVSGTDGNAVTWINNIKCSTTEIYFSTDNDERMRIASGGNVGIGTKSPDRKLHVELNDNTYDAVSYPLRLTHISDNSLGGSGNGTGIEFETETGYGLFVGGTIESYYSYMHDNANCFNLALRTLIDQNLTTMLTLDGRDYVKGIVCSYPIYGGTTGGENLYLRSDSTLVKGNVIIADDGGDVSLGGANSVVYATTMPAGEDNSVVILDADGSLRTDEIDPRVWGTSLIDDTDMSGYFLLAGRAGSQTAYGGTAAGEDLYLRSTANATKGNVIIADDGGNVGIGTTDPGAQLEIKVNRTSSTSAVALLLNDNVSGGAQTDGVYKSIRSHSGLAGSAVSEIRFLQNDGTNNNTGIAFATQQTAGGLTERMRVDRNGNVGIGTTDPGAQLEIKVNRTSSTSAVALLLNDNVVGAQTDGVYKSIRSHSSSGNAVSEIRFLQNDGTNNNTGIAFATQQTAGGLAERMRVNRVGHVGIGTTDPGTFMLNVNGTVNFGSTINAADIGAGVDNSVLVLTTDGTIRTDEIDPRVWGTSLVDVSGTPETGYYARFIDADTVEGRTAAQVLSDIGAQAALTNPVTGTGTAGYIPKFSGTSALANSVIYETGGKVGIGDTDPSEKLTVNGAIRATGDIYKDKDAAGVYCEGIYQAIRDADDWDGSARMYVQAVNNANTKFNCTQLIAHGAKNNYNYFDLTNNYSTGIILHNNQNSNPVYVGADTLSDLVFGTSNHERMRIASGGNVGIGDTDLSEKLTVDGTVKSNALATNASYSWTLGGYDDDSVPAATGYVTITIEGTTYKLLAATA